MARYMSSKRSNAILSGDQKNETPLRTATLPVKSVESVFESLFGRIELAAGKIEDTSFPWKPNDLSNVLRNEIIELEALYELVPGVLEGDPTAEINFRSWLSFESDDLADDPEDDEAEDKYISESVLRGKSLGKTAPEKYEFATANVFLDICLAAAKIAVDDDDLAELNIKIMSLLERAEWLEELNRAAAVCDKTGHTSEFRRLARLYHRMGTKAPIEAAEIDLDEVSLTISTKKTAVPALLPSSAHLTKTTARSHDFSTRKSPPPLK